MGCASVNCSVAGSPSADSTLMGGSKKVIAQEFVSPLTKALIKARSKRLQVNSA
jgi:hypothetical protein